MLTISNDEFRKLNKFNAKNHFNNEQKYWIKKVENIGVDVKNHDGSKNSLVLIFFKDGGAAKFNYSIILKILDQWDYDSGATHINSLKLVGFLTLKHLIHNPRKTKRDTKTILLGIKCIGAIGAYSFFSKLMASQKDKLFLLNKEYQALNKFKNFTGYNATKAFIKFFSYNNSFSRI